MALPTFTMRQLLESGVHFGHVTRRWNPKMEPYIFGTRQGIHILDLQQTVPLLYRAMQIISEIVSGGGRVLLVGTKRQASSVVEDAAKRCGQYYVNHRWLGGMMTNWNTISNSIQQLHKLDESLSEEHIGLTKKELLKLNRERDKLERDLGGIKDLGGLPDIIFVIDTNKESIAVAEANKLSEIIRGEGDAVRNRVYADAFRQDEEFFVFYRSLQAYRKALQAGDTTMVLSPNSDFFRYFGDPLGGSKASDKE